MLIVEKISDDFLSIKCNYSEDYVHRLRQVPGAKFSRENKIWIIPIGAFEWFEELFDGEIIFKTPRWIITGDPMPDYTKQYTLDTIIDLPELYVKPYNYQEYGVKFMINKLLKNGFVINADDVGLGKTLQAITSIKYLYENGDINKVLVVCKKSLKRQWKNEINKFTDLSNSMIIDYVDGDKKERNKKYNYFNCFECGILIMNYHTVMNDYEVLSNMGFDMVVIDEAHAVKARTGVMNNAIASVAQNAKYVIFLTGTPIMSKPDDIFGVVQIATKDYFGNWKEFQENYIKYERKGRRVMLVGYKNLNELREKVQDIVIRRTEHEVTLDLPKVIFKKLEVDIDNTQKSLQEKIKEDRTKVAEELEVLISKKNKTDEDKMEIEQKEGMIKGFTAALQAIADDPRLFHLSKSKAMQKKYGTMIPANYKMSSKTEMLLDLVEEIVETEHKVIIFTRFERATQLLKEDIEKNLKINVLLYTGDVDDETREMNIDLFKNDNEYNVLIGTDAMAEGLNLQVANHIINYDQPFTPAIKTQRMGRARRAGSLHDRVFVYDLITVDSEDIRMIENIEKASDLFDGIVSVNIAQSEAIKKVMNG